MATQTRALFICKGNWFRSQMAAAIYNNSVGAELAHSAGTYAGAADEPEGQRLADLFPTPDFFQTMERRGMSVRENRTRRLTPEMLTQYDIVVSMAEEPFVPDFLAQAPHVIRWTVPNPRVVNERVAEEIFEQVRSLVASLLTEKNPRALP
jgi:protein-tyrosine-phosphatase